MNLPLKLARRLPRPLKERLKDVAVRRPSPRWGNLRRVRPFGEKSGGDRGTPIDRVYIEAFLDLHSGDVRGSVLEVGDARYTRRIGAGSVTEIQIVDIDPANPRATIAADLGQPGSLPADRFDCAILTQTLQYVADPGAAVANVVRALAPGGVLLVAVPGVARILFGPDGLDRWRWTPAGLEELLRNSAPDLEIEVQGYGNVLTATAFLLGLAAEELTREELEVADPAYAILACARAQSMGHA